jgi:hypothetical protein
MTACSLALTLLLSAEAPQVAKPIPIPGGAGGIGFDDLGFAPSLHRVLVPGGRTGNLLLIDPATREVTAISGFSTESSFGGGHGAGTTSADEGRRVTEPGAEQIEIFSIPAQGTPTLAQVAVVKVAGGPESLVVDPKRDRAYTHLWKLETVAIDLHAKSVAARWKNGCQESRGITLDEDSATMAVVAVAPGGKLSTVATVPTAKSAHCVAADDRGGAWICDPEHGEVLFFKDASPAQ